MKVMIAGLGLIGGSFALALRDHALAEEILGVERSPEHAAEALRLGLADRMVTSRRGWTRPTSWCLPCRSMSCR